MGGSMSSIVVSGDTSGAITIAAPAVAGTNTLTLPASTGTVALTSGLPSASVLCRAWCNYNGSSQTIINSYNISSVTYNGTGDYTFNYTSALPNSNNAVVCSGSGDGGPATPNLYGAAGTNTTTSVRIYGNSVNHFANTMIVFG